MVTTVERQPGWQSVPWSEYVKDLVDDIAEVEPHSNIMILTGEAHPDIYNHDDFIEVTRLVKQRKRISFSVITGSIILTKDGHNGLLDLHDEGIIDHFYHRLSWGKMSHFRIVAIRNGYNFSTESAHTTLLPPDQRQALRVQAGPRDHEYPTILTHLRVFDNWVKMITERDEREPSRGKYLPLLTTEDALGELVKSVTEANLPFYDLGPKELLGLPGGRERLKPRIIQHHRLNGKINRINA